MICDPEGVFRSKLRWNYARFDLKDCRQDCIIIMTIDASTNNCHHLFTMLNILSSEIKLDDI